MRNLQSPRSSASPMSLYAVALLLVAVGWVDPRGVRGAALGQFQLRPSLMFSAGQVDGQSVVALLGEDVVLDCEASGHPTPTIHWLHNGMRIVQGADRDVLDDEAAFETHSSAAAGSGKGSVLSTTRSRLYVDCAKPVDAGVYTCVAETPTKRIVSRAVVEVVQPNGKMAKRRGITNSILPRHRVKSDSAEQGRYSAYCANKHSSSAGSPARVYMWTVHRIDMEGTDVQLFCRTAGSPSPAITWYNRDERPITVDDDQYRVLPNGDLLIRDVSFAANMGMYRCVATNDAGSDSADTFLYPTTLD